MCSTVVSLIFCSIVIALTGIYMWLTYCLRVVIMEKRSRRPVGRPSKKKTESATQQYKVADIDPHNYDVFETRY